jgi:hypothetical protein
MRNKINAFKIPQKKIGKISVPQLILGHLPFIGESYQGLEKNREYVNRFSNLNNIVKILRIAVEEYSLAVTSGGTSNNYLLNLFLQAIKKTEQLTKIKMAMIPCIQIPLVINEKPVDTYKRWMTHYEIEKRFNDGKILKKYLEDPILLCRKGWKAKFKEILKKSRSYEKKELDSLQIDYEKLDKSIDRLQNFNVLFAEIGSETDFLVGTNRLDLLKALISHIKNRFGYRLLIGVHHAGITLPKLENSKIKFDGYVTPINKLGVMMFPTRVFALKAIKNTKKPVIAIKTLGGGRINPNEAFKHVYEELGVNFCMIGIGSEDEAIEDFSIASKILRKDK